MRALIVDQIFLRDNNRCWVIQVRRIRQLQLEDNYTRIYFENESALVLRSLAALEKRLPSKLFFRANRTQILNLSCIEGVVFDHGGARREFRAVA